MNFTGDLQNFHPKTSIIFNDVTHDAQICYHLVYPKNFELVKRPKRTIPANRDASNNKRRRRGRPRKEDTIKSVDNVDAATVAEKSDENLLKLPCSRTRSGRVSRPPKHMSKFVDMKDARTTVATATTTTTFTTTMVTSTAEVLPIVELDHLALFSAAALNGHGGDAQQPTGPQKEPRKIRKNVDRFTCSVCKKIYLGRKKLLRHYFNFPDHRTTSDKPQSSQTHAQNMCSNDETPANLNGVHSFLFDELMKVVGRSTQVERVPTFLYELSNFLCKVRSFRPKLMHTNGSSTEHFLDRHVSRLFDLPEGLANLDNEAFNAEHSHCDTMAIFGRQELMTLDGPGATTNVMMDLCRPNVPIEMSRPNVTLGLNSHSVSMNHQRPNTSLSLGRPDVTMHLDRQGPVMTLAGSNTIMGLGATNVPMSLHTPTSNMNLNGPATTMALATSNVSQRLNGSNLPMTLTGSTTTMTLDRPNVSMALNTPSSRMSLDAPIVTMSHTSSSTLNLNNSSATVSLNMPTTTLAMETPTPAMILNRPNSTAFTSFSESSSNDLRTAMANLDDLDYGLNLFQPVAYDHQISDNAIESDVLAKLNRRPVSAQEPPILDIPMDLFSFDNN